MTDAAEGQTAGHTLGAEEVVGKKANDVQAEAVGTDQSNREESDNAGVADASKADDEDGIAKLMESKDKTAELGSEINHGKTVDNDDAKLQKGDAQAEGNGTDDKNGGDSHTDVPVSAHERKSDHRGRGGPNKFAGNRKPLSKFESQPESSNPTEIRRQVEFYFSDSNLPIDEYLLSLTGGSKNRPVPLKLIHSFKRMRHFQPYSAVRDAVKASKFLTITGDDDEITRNVPLDSRFSDDSVANRSLVHSMSMGRSIYAKGFGGETDSTQLDIEAFFAPYGPVRSVRLRRGNDNRFKSSVFVEFENEELAQQFLELDPKPRWVAPKKNVDGVLVSKGNNDKTNDEEKQAKESAAEEKDTEEKVVEEQAGKGKADDHVDEEEEVTELEVMSKQDYVDLKHEGILEGTVKPRSPTRGFRGGRGNNQRGRGNKQGPRDWVDKDDWKDRRDRDQREDRRGGRGGRGNKRGGRGGRSGRDDRDRGEKGHNDRRERDREDAKDIPPTRAEAEAARDTKPGASAKAPREETNGSVESKKRDRDGADHRDVEDRDVKKVKEDHPQN